MPSNPYDDQYPADPRGDYVSNGGTLPDAADPYAPTTWGAPVEYDFQTPSGQLCRMRRIDVLELMETDLLHSVDFLTGAVHKEVIPQNRAARRAAMRSSTESAEVATNSDAAEEVLEKLKQDPEKTSKFIKVLEEIVIRAVVKPQLYPMPEPGSPLVPGRVYIQSVDFNDRMAIFNKAMEGTAKMQTFRDEAEESERVVEDGKGI